jgi:hypothetical protein
MSTTGLLDIILKIDYHTKTIQIQFGFIWIYALWVEDFYLKFYKKNKPKLHNWYKSANRKILETRKSRLATFPTVWMHIQFKGK